MKAKETNGIMWTYTTCVGKGGGLARRGCSSNTGPFAMSATVRACSAADDGEQLLGADVRPGVAEAGSPARAGGMGGSVAAALAPAGGLL